MNLKELKAKGGLIPSALVPKEVTWKHVAADTGKEEEDTFTIYVRKHSFGTVERLFSGQDERNRSARYISESIMLGENGRDRLSFDDAFQLDTGLALIFIKAINDVNGTGSDEPKNSLPLIESGAISSPTESAAEQ